jgi:hypothetical protein
MVIASLPSLYWWCLLVLTSAPLYIRADSLFNDLYRFYLILGGSLGWICLAGLVVLQYLRPQPTPRWMVLGAAIGTSVAVSIVAELPPTWFLAIPPVVAAASLLVRGIVMARNPVKDGYGT